MSTICHFGSYTTSNEYSRNSAVRKALVDAGFSILECTAPDTIQRDRYRAFSNPFVFLRLVLATIRQWATLCWRHFKISHYDVMLVGYPCHVDLLLAVILAKIRGKPVVADFFIGLYETVVEDRQYISHRNPLAKLLRYWDWFALTIPTAVMVDTQAHADSFTKEYSVAPEKIWAIPVGIDEEVWFPTPLPEENELFRVGFWSKFIPLHGCDVLAQAAALLEKRGLHCEIAVVGDGQTAPLFEKIIEREKIRNIIWKRGYYDIEVLVDTARRSHCCIGIMGNSSKGDLVVPYKVYHALAAARPVITANTTAMRDIFKHGENIYLFPPGDPEALADAIIALSKSPHLRRKIAGNGRIVFDRQLSLGTMSHRLGDKLATLLNGTHRATERR